MNDQQGVQEWAAPNEMPLEPPVPTKRIGKHLTKTRYCKHYLRGYCRYGHKCAYAHQADELMPKPDLIKTKLCLSFFSGACLNENCTYAHGMQEMRRARPKMSNGATHQVYAEPVSANTSAAHRQQMFPTAEATSSPVLEAELLPGLASQLSKLPHPAQQAAREAAWQAAQMAAEQAVSKVLYNVNGSNLQTPHGPGEAAQRQQQEQVWQANSNEETHLLHAVLTKLAQQYTEEKEQESELYMEKQKQDAWKLRGDHSALPGEAARNKEVMQLYMEKQQQAREARAVARWGSLATNVLSTSKRSFISQYEWLWNCENSHRLTEREEYVISFMFLRDAKWVPIFPGLAQRCSVRLAQHLRQLWEEESGVTARATNVANRRAPT